MVDDDINVRSTDYTDIIYFFFAGRLFFLSSDMELYNRDQILIFSFPNDADDVSNDHFYNELMFALVSNEIF